MKERFDKTADVRKIAKGARDEARRKEEHAAAFHKLPTNDVELGFFEGRLKINPENIDQELIEQPSNYYDIADALALAKSRRDLQKDEYKTVEASLKLHIRDRRERDGEKVTDKLIEDLVQVHPDRLRAYEEYVETEREVGRLEALRDSFRDRGFMLRELAELHLGGMTQQNSVRGPDYAKRELEAVRVEREMAEKRAAKMRDRERRR